MDWSDRQRCTREYAVVTQAVRLDGSALTASPRECLPASAKNEPESKSTLSMKEPQKGAPRGIRLAFFSSCFVIGMSASFGIPSLLVNSKTLVTLRIGTKRLSYLRGELTGPEPQPLDPRCSQLILLVLHTGTTELVHG